MPAARRSPPETGSTGNGPALRQFQQALASRIVHRRIRARPGDQHQVAPGLRPDLVEDDLLLHVGRRPGDGGMSEQMASSRLPSWLESRQRSFMASGSAPARQAAAAGPAAGAPARATPPYAEEDAAGCPAPPSASASARHPCAAISLNISCRMRSAESPSRPGLEAHAGGKPRLVGRTLAVARMEAEEAQDAQIVFRDPLLGVADEDHAAAQDVRGSHR